MGKTMMTLDGRMRCRQRAGSLSDAFGERPRADRRSKSSRVARVADLRVAWLGCRHLRGGSCSMKCVLDRFHFSSRLGDMLPTHDVETNTALATRYHDFGLSTLGLAIAARAYM